MNNSMGNTYVRDKKFFHGFSKLFGDKCNMLAQKRKETECWRILFDIQIVTLALKHPNVESDKSSVSSSL